MPEIHGYHAHIYYDAATLVRARALCETAQRELGVQMGRMHERCVGPHPQWSCQLSFGVADFATVVPWLALHRDGLVVFLHPLTGDELADHRDYALWMGAMYPLELDALLA